MKGNRELRVGISGIFLCDARFEESDEGILGVIIDRDHEGGIAGATARETRLWPHHSDRKPFCMRKTENSSLSERAKKNVH